jgi:hypothetical protein
LQLKSLIQSLSVVFVLLTRKSRAHGVKMPTAIGREYRAHYIDLVEVCWPVSVEEYLRLCFSLIVKLTTDGERCVVISGTKKAVVPDGMA